jgi:hypothetical protein
MRTDRRTFVSAMAAAPFAAAQAPQTEQWGRFELSLPGPSAGNPFLEVEFGARFVQGSVSEEADGFYDGDGMYRVRFMPERQGEWTYETRSNVAQLSGKRGSFRVGPPSRGNRGPVRAHNQFHFAYADGARHTSVGTTCYAWIHQSEELQQQTLRTLRTAPFNKMRMCVFPKHYAFNRNEPPYYAFLRDANGKQDFTRFDPRFFRHLEQRVMDLQALGVEADLILFHPYDRWGYAEMSAETDDRYLRYIVARLSSFRNVWWSLANEFNFMKKKTVADFDRFCQIVKQKDPYGHLLSVHNGGSEAEVLYDYSKPWITHVSIQSRFLSSGMELRQKYGKAVVFDECYYEGDIPQRWGNISGDEMARRFWLGTVNGCYVGHGETYLHPKDILWWSHGGQLHGESPSRIAFLRKILEEAPAGLTPMKSYFPGAMVENRYYLYYLDIHRPRRYTLELPKEGSWQIDIIDPWQMTIAPVGKPFSGKAELELPGRPYMALRVRRG